MTYLNVSFAPEVCAGCFYCQNSLAERLSSLKTSETGSPRLEPSPFSLCPRHYSSKDFHKMQFSFSRNFLTAVGAHQLLCRSRASQRDHRDGGKAGVPLSPDNSQDKGLSLHFLSLKTLPEESLGISALFWIIYLYPVAVVVLWLCCLILC